MSFVLSQIAIAGTVIDSLLNVNKIFINRVGSFLVRPGGMNPSYASAKACMKTITLTMHSKPNCDVG